MYVEQLLKELCPITYPFIKKSELEQISPKVKKQLIILKRLKYFHQLTEDEAKQIDAFACLFDLLPEMIAKTNDMAWEPIYWTIIQCESLSENERALIWSRVLTNSFQSELRPLNILFHFGFDHYLYFAGNLLYLLKHLTPIHIITSGFFTSIPPDL